jgi:hypothetical protein
VVISQSGSPSTDVPVAIQWQTTSVASGGAYTIRKGDSLLLVADDGYVDERNVIIDPYDDGSDLRYGVGSTRHRVSYNESGTYVATAYHDMNGDGIGSPTESLGSIAIQVVDFSFPSYVPCQVGYGRELIIDTGAMNSDQVLLSPAIAGSIAIGSLSKAGTSIMTTINPAVENSPVLQAKNVDGAILAARQISTFVFSEPTGSKMLASAWYPDGTVRVGGEYTISPMRLDLDVIVRIFTTGSAFDDGGIELRMSSNDFSLDKFGVAHGIFSIVRSGKSSSAPCHTAVVKYKETIVGR